MTEATKVPNCPLVTGQRPCLCIMPRCPECAYTEHDAQFEGDHDRCNGKIPVASAPEREKCHKIICPHRPAYKAAHYCPHCDGSAAAAFCICETASADEIREAFGGELKTFSPTFLETDIKRCSRCGNDHPALRFVSFIFDAPPDASHWAMCPQLKEPILLSIEPVTPDAPDEDEPIRCGTFSEESLNRKPEQQAPAHVRAFGRSLRTLREDFGLTLGDLADILGVRVSRLSDVERGIQREASTTATSPEVES